jgi:hypothetical protein
MKAQTTVQNSDALRWGSAKFEAALKSDGFGSLQDLGALRNIKVVESWEDVVVSSDNAGRVLKSLKNQKLTITAEWLEPEFSKLDMLRGGDLDTYDTVSDTPVSITDEAVVLNDTDSVRLLYKNADNTEVDSIVVTQAGDPCARNTDYVIGVDSEGYTIIARIDGSAVIEDGSTVLVDYDYTPASSKTFKTGGYRTISPIVIRLTNEDEDSNGLVADIYEAYISAGLDLSYKSDDADDVNVLPLSFEAICDETRSVGDQLWAITDEQAV